MLKSVDHIALVVRDLKTATERYSALLGCSPDWHGADGGAEHMWFQLGNMALDIIAPIGSGYTGDRVQAQLDQYGEGVWAIAFATTDINATCKTLSRRGVASTEPRRIRSTNVESGDKRYWNTSVLAAEATHGTTIFLVDQAIANQASVDQASDATRSPLTPTTTDKTALVSGLDHVVITTAQPERAAALYGARLGLDMKLDRTNPEWGSRLMFFKCGDLVVEIAHSLKTVDTAIADKAWGLSWRAPDIAAAHARMTQTGFNLSEVRTGRKPGTQLFTVRDAPANVPTIVMGKS